MAREFLTNSEEETGIIAAKITAVLSLPAVITLEGDIGAGKTVFSRSFARALGVKGPVSSPTFNIVQEYELDEGVLYHMDLYRLNSLQEALDIGIEDYLYSGHWNFVEWPEKVEQLLPGESTRIELTKNDNGSRTLSVRPVK